MEATRGSDSQRNNSRKIHLQQNRIILKQFNIEDGISSQQMNNATQKSISIYSHHHGQPKLVDGVEQEGVSWSSKKWWRWKCLQSGSRSTEEFHPVQLEMEGEGWGRRGGVSVPASVWRVEKTRVRSNNALISWNGSESTSERSLTRNGGATEWLKRVWPLSETLFQ